MSTRRSTSLLRCTAPEIKDSNPDNPVASDSLDLASPDRTVDINRAVLEVMHREDSEVMLRELTVNLVVITHHLRTADSHPVAKTTMLRPVASQVVSPTVV
uniref:(northern house mosquito) hypothetical protein n=1 Tax=Culex pipiens TaxID=7175 RepID=A0A8D8KIZ5_CULPI